MTNLNEIRERYPWYENDPGYMEFMTAGDLSLMINTIEKLQQHNAQRLMVSIMAVPDGAGKPFIVYRHHDVSGVSGTGVVADGIEFPDGRVAMRWRGEDGSTVIHDSIQTVEKIHGHGGNTIIVWIAEELPPILEALDRIEELEAEVAALREERRTA